MEQRQSFSALLNDPRGPRHAGATFLGAVGGAAKEFSQSVSRHLAAILPAQFSAKMGQKNRVGKVFVDYLSQLKRQRILARLKKQQRQVT